ncbi:MAG: DUF1207 domain-containing protein [Chlorobiaceae bacterium]
MNRARFCNKSPLLLFVFFLLSINTATAESLNSSASKTLFAPLTADPMEPRIAVMPRIGKQLLQLDIGSSADVYTSESREFATGVDFGTWSLLHQRESFKFPVDAIDYIFGVNASWKKQLQNEGLPFEEFSGRVRLSHISAHFEDGHTDASGAWIQGDCPFPIPFTYSREFVNLVLALSSPGHRVYGGYQYLYHSIPDGINPHSFQAGAELSTTRNSWLALDFKLLPLWRNELSETKGFRGTWNLQAGMRLDQIGLDKVKLACGWSSGMSRHGMYFYKPESFAAAGIIIDL